MMVLYFSEWYTQTKHTNGLGREPREPHSLDRTTLATADLAAGKARGLPSDSDKAGSWQSTRRVRGEARAASPALAPRCRQPSVPDSAWLVVATGAISVSGAGDTQ